MRANLVRKIKSGDELAFYYSKEWKDLRLKIIQRDNNECQQCKSKGKQSRCEAVHHIKHLKDFPEIGLRPENLVCLCKSCHNEAHPEKLPPKKKKKVTTLPERWE